jgi:hypothetical protein
VQEELRVVTSGKLAERNEEVAQRQTELVVLSVVGEKTFNKLLNLGTVCVSAGEEAKRVRVRGGIGVGTYAVRLLKALWRIVATKLAKNSRLSVPA